MPRVPASTPVCTIHQRAPAQNFRGLFSIFSRLASALVHLDPRAFNLEAARTAWASGGPHQYITLTGLRDPGAPPPPATPRPAFIAGQLDAATAVADAAALPSVAQQFSEAAVASEAEPAAGNTSFNAAPANADAARAKPAQSDASSAGDRSSAKNAAAPMNIHARAASSVPVGGTAMASTTAHRPTPKRGPGHSKK